MPLGPYADWDACIADQRKKGRSDEVAARVCGAIERDTKPHSFALETVSLKGVEIFDVGTWNGDPYTDAQLDEMVANTMTLKRKGLLEPPVKLGHGDKQGRLEDEGMPAGGWIERVYRVGTKVVADLSDVPAKLADLVRSKAYRKVSAEIWPKFGKAADGQTYGYVLKAIAFLGGEIPAVPTLKDIAALYGLRDEREVRAFAQAQHREVVVFTSGDDEDDDPARILEALERVSERARAKAKGKRGAPRARAILDEALTKLRAIVMGPAHHELDDDERLELENAIGDIDTKKCATCKHGAASHKAGGCAMAGCDCDLTKAEVDEATRDHAAAAHSFDVVGGEPPLSELPVKALPAEAFADAAAKAFPHHHLRGGKLYTHAGGVRAAFNALAGGAAASEAVKAHIRDHAARLGIEATTKNAEDVMDKETLKALGLEEDATPEQIKAKVTELAARNAEQEKELKKHADERLLTEAKGKVDAAIRSRKLTPAQEAWATDYAQKDPAGFEAYVKAAPTVFSDARGQAGSGSDSAVEAGDDPTKALDLLARKAMAADKTLDYGQAIRQVGIEHPELAGKYARSAPAVRSN